MNDLGDYANWHKIKSKIQHSGRRPECKEGEVWFVYLGKNIGYEENGSGSDFIRPVVILKNISDYFSVICIPLTTTERFGKLYYNLRINGKNNTALLGHIKLIDRKRCVYKTKENISKNTLEIIKQKITELLL